VTAAASSSVRVSRPYAWLKPGVFAGCLVPLAMLVFDALRGRLGADPVAIALNRLGLLALITLLASMSATPLRLMFGWAWPLRLRRMLGLFAFFYASLHFLVYLAVDQGFAWPAILQDVTERKFITAGFLAFLILLPLAATSPSAVRRKLGPLRWQRLHRLVYLAGILACVHFIWRVKRDLSQPLMYALIAGVLLLVRLERRK
jgi:methionine sulfoxide reductase heme-binding subunit